MRAEIEIEPVEFTARVPKGRLSRFVEVLWYWSGYHVPKARERLMPMGTTELVIQLRNPNPSESGLAGPRSAPLIIDRSHSDELLGVHFRPGGIFPFLTFPAGLLHNRNVSLEDLWGAGPARQFLERLSLAPTVGSKLTVLERWLAVKSLGRGDHHPAVAYALERFQCDPGLLSTASAAAAVNLSERRFIQVFDSEVGLTPKRFCRVQRFQNVISAIQFRTEVDWADVAASHGYTDQSHFIHDFRSFTGLRPGEYLGLRTEHLNHVRVPD